MVRYEYKVVAAPRKGLKAKGVKSTEDRFAHALTEAMNDMAVEGWEYLRADTLPCEEREGLMGKTTHFQHMLVFRRAIDAVAEEPQEAPAALIEDKRAEDVAEETAAPEAADEPEETQPVEPPLTRPVTDAPPEVSRPETRAAE